MPLGDRTGPLGEGPKTGRKLGYGAGYDSPGYTKGPGRGFGRGFFGRGRGLGRRYFSGRGFFWPKRVVTEEDIPETSGNIDEIRAIQSEVQELKDGLANMMTRLNQLTPEKKEK